MRAQFLVPWTPFACTFMSGINLWWTKEFVGFTVGVLGFGFIVEYQRKAKRTEPDCNTSPQKSDVGTDG